jgi:hypothetical protein
MKIVIALFCACFLQFSGFSQTNEVVVKPGLLLELINSKGERSATFRSDEDIIYRLVSTGTNKFYIGVLPDSDKFVVSLRDSSGRNVEKTELGKSRSRAVDESKVRRVGTRGFYVTPTMGYYRRLFRPKDFFVLERKGEYTLELRIRFWTQEVPKGSSGVITSAPLHVTIVND